jgi:hypothetical protein
LAGDTGKRGWAVELSADSTTLEYTEQKEHFEIRDTVSHVLTTTVKSNIVDLFSIGASKIKGEIKDTKPFVHQVQFHGPQGEIVRAWANIDDGAMKEVMSKEKLQKVKHRLGRATPSGQLLRVANGAIIQSEARWEGEIEVNGVKTDVAFEVFDSGGKWDFLFGKTLLEAFKATHDYNLDKITIYGRGGNTTLTNQFHTTGQRSADPPDPKTPVCLVTDEPQQQEDDEPSEVNVDAFQGNRNLFTRMTDPQKPERVQELLRLITIGDDLNPEQREKVQELITSFADVFALSVSEVKIADDAVHKLDIPPETKFPMKVHQKPLTPPQRRYLYESIDTMLEAGVIEACSPDMGVHTGQNAYNLFVQHDRRFLLMIIVNMP